MTKGERDGDILFFFVKILLVVLQVSKTLGHFLIEAGECARPWGAITSYFVLAVIGQQYMSLIKVILEMIRAKKKIKINFDNSKNCRSNNTVVIEEFFKCGLIVS